MKVYALIAILLLLGIVEANGEPNPNLDANRKFIPQLRASLSHIAELSKQVKLQKAVLEMDRSDDPSLEQLEAEVRQLKAEETMLKTRNKLMSILHPHDEQPHNVYKHNP